MGEEVYNFKNYKDQLYGYVQAPWSRIAIQKLGASPKADSVNNITVFWVAAKKGGGVYVVGWYVSATVYRAEQLPNGELEIARAVPEHVKQAKDGVETCNYNVRAAIENIENSVLLLEEERTYHIPTGKGFMGRSNIWYPLDEEKAKLLGLLKTPFVHHTSIAGAPKQQDIAKRLAVENAAMQAVWDFYYNQKFKVNDVSDKNCGWDLVATKEGTTLCIEVKGRSVSEIAVELTPNEYDKFKEQKTDYRLCVVTNALQNDKLLLHNFRYQDSAYRDQHGHKLKVKERIAAGLSVDV